MVSIILPNLNTPLEFLEPRINSLLSQSYTNWECIAIDGFSTNGSWEMILEKTKGDNRFSYYQKPAKGIYDAWNEGTALAKGEYIYIATSDDTCSDTFLQEMSGALDANMDCEIAHCCLNIIDNKGDLTPNQWHDWEKVKFYGEYMQKIHKRIAPYDAVVHFGWSTVYASVVQLLIRKSLIDRVGNFSTSYGSIADFEWGFRASMSANIIHLPLYLASWRKHETQASDDNYFTTPEFFADLQKMAANAIKVVKSDHRIYLRNQDGLFFNYLYQQFIRTPRKSKIGFLISSSFTRPYLTLKVIFYQLFNIKFDTSAFLKEQLNKRNMSGLLTYSQAEN